VNIEQGLQQLLVACIANNEIASSYGGFEACREIVERNHIFAGSTQLPYHVTADISRAAGDQYLLVFHGFISIDSMRAPKL
jgi:hypothetical protein